MESNKNDIIELKMMKTSPSRFPNECSDERTNSTEINNVAKYAKLLGQAVDSYVNFIVPQKRYRYTAAEERARDVVDFAGKARYLTRYAPVAMTVISFIQVVCLVVDEIIRRSNTGVTIGPINIFQYDLYNRQECWRFFTYMLVHSDYIHLSVNLIVQIFLSIPMEMANQWWKVVIVYFSGVIAGSLATSIIEPTRYLVGGSGGGCALATAQIYNLASSWNEEEYVWLRMLVIIMVIIPDTGYALYKRLISLDQSFACTAHIGGSAAGLLVGLWILKNGDPTNEKKSRTKYSRWIATALFILLVVIAISLNIFWTDHFPSL